jgi:hypothetical protein
MLIDDSASNSSILMVVAPMAIVPRRSVLP